MKKLFTIALAALFALGAGTFAGCSKYDDSDLRRELEELQKQLDDQKDRIAALEALTKSLGDRIDDGAAITALTELPDGAGWRIEFTKGDPIEIRHGSDGKDGANGAPGKDGTNGTPGDTKIADIVDNGDGTVTIVLADNGGSFTFAKEPSLFTINGNSRIATSGTMEYYGDEYADYVPDSENIYVMLFDADHNNVLFLDFVLEAGNDRLTAGTYNVRNAAETGIVYGFDGGNSSAFDADVNALSIIGGTVTVSVSGSGDAAVYTIVVDCSYTGIPLFGIPGGTVRGTFRGTLAWSDQS